MGANVAVFEWPALGSEVGPSLVASDGRVDERLCGLKEGDFVKFSARAGLDITIEGMEVAPPFATDFGTGAKVGYADGFTTTVDGAADGIVRNGINKGGNVK